MRTGNRQNVEAIFMCMDELRSWNINDVERKKEKKHLSGG